MEVRSSEEPELCRKRVGVEVCSSGAWEVRCMDAWRYRVPEARCRRVGMEVGGLETSFSCSDIQL